MTVVVAPSDIITVEGDAGITVVSPTPVAWIVTEVDNDVTVVSADTQVSVVSLETNPVVVAVNEQVTVVSNEFGYVGPYIYVQNTQPVSPAIGDIWVVTA